MGISKEILIISICEIENYISEMQNLKLKPLPANEFEYIAKKPSEPIFCDEAVPDWVSTHSVIILKKVITMTS